MPDGSEGRLDHVARTDVSPVLGREVEEREHGLAVLGETLHCLGIFRLVGAHELLENGKRAGPGFRHPDLLQRSLRLGLHRFGQIVQNVRNFEWKEPWKEPGQAWLIA